MDAASWTDARNLLCVRLDSLGDVLMTTPAIRALKQSIPNRRITLLTSASGAAVAHLVPEIDDVLVYDSPWMKHTPRRPDARHDAAMIDALAARSFDAAAIFTVYTQNPLPAALLCYLAEIPLRLAHCRENPYQLLTHWVPDPEPRTVRHEVRRQLDLVATAGATCDDETLSLAVPAASRSKTEQLLRTSGVRIGEPWVVVHPGATAASRRYPPELYAEVVRRLARHGLQVVLTGSAGERPLCEDITRAATAERVPTSGAFASPSFPREWERRPGREGPMPVISLAGDLDLPVLAALIQRAPLLISNNTGPVHIAAAVGTPVVDIYALTNPQHSPWRVPNRVLTHDVPCRNCLSSVCPEGHHACLRMIRPGDVVAAALELLADTGHVVPVQAHV